MKLPIFLIVSRFSKVEGLVILPTSLLYIYYLLYILYIPPNTLSSQFNFSYVPLFTASTANERVLAFHLYRLSNVKQEQNVICSICSE